MEFVKDGMEIDILLSQDEPLIGFQCPGSLQSPPRGDVRVAEGPQEGNNKRFADWDLVLAQLMMLQISGEPFRELLPLVMGEAVRIELAQEFRYRHGCPSHASARFYETSLATTDGEASQQNTPLSGGRCYSLGQPRTLGYIPWVTE